MCNGKPNLTVSIGLLLTSNLFQFRTFITFVFYLYCVNIHQSTNLKVYFGTKTFKMPNLSLVTDNRGILRGANVITNKQRYKNWCAVYVADADSRRCWSFSGVRAASSNKSKSLAGWMQRSVV
jgi:hypothetical protein